MERGRLRRDWLKKYLGVEERTTRCMRSLVYLIVRRSLTFAAYTVRRESKPTAR